jgi:hypothetical protein
MGVVRKTRTDRQMASYERTESGIIRYWHDKTVNSILERMA